MTQVYSFPFPADSVGDLGRKMARVIGGEDFSVRQRIEELYVLVRGLPHGPMQRMSQPSCLGKWVFIACDERLPIAMMECRITVWFGEIWLRLDDLVVHSNHLGTFVEELLIEAAKVKAQGPLPDFAQSLLLTRLQAVAGIHQTALQAALEECQFQLIETSRHELLYDYDLIGR